MSQPGSPRAGPSRWCTKEVRAHVGRERGRGFSCGVVRAQGSSLLSSTPYYHLVPVLPEKVTWPSTWRGRKYSGGIVRLIAHRSCERDIVCQNRHLSSLPHTIRTGDDGEGYDTARSTLWLLFPLSLSLPGWGPFYTVVGARRRVASCFLDLFVFMTSLYEVRGKGRPYQKQSTFPVVRFNTL